MKFLRVLFGAGIGWWMFGPIGGLVGMILGNLVNASSSELTINKTTSRDGFVVSLLVLMAAVMKSDGKILKSELDYVKGQLVHMIGEEKAAEALLMLRDMLKKDIPLLEVSHQIRINVDYQAKIQLLHLLFGLGKSDGFLGKQEIHIIHEISGHLGISDGDYQSVLNMFYDNTEAAYKVLEIEPHMSDEEVKKAFRKMAIRFHPDKVTHLGEEFQGPAKEKFQKVNEAYDKIKKERGLV
jgi:DnaJ like chaperone protein